MSIHRFIRPRLSTGVRFVHSAEESSAQETPTAPWQAAYERAARETGLLVLAAAGVLLGALVLLLRFI